MRKYVIAGLVALAVVGAALALSRSARETLTCKEATEVQLSPGGKYRAQLTSKACGQGAGQASDLARLKVDMQDKPGWFIEIPLEYSTTIATPPSIKWKNANALEVTVYSNDLTGTLVRHMGSLTVTRRYVAASGAKAPAKKKGKSKS